MDGKLALYRESELYKIMVKEVAVRRFFLGVRRSPQSPPPPRSVPGSSLPENDY